MLQKTSHPEDPYLLKECLFFMCMLEALQSPFFAIINGKSFERQNSQHLRLTKIRGPFLEGRVRKMALFIILFAV
jgi:hypothetical protein